ncbi:MAG TPA: PaaI family thioesterase [Nocardioidaceae bacterium]|nr:PaaI family thioesterase [Nocardioidaceae bacterium]
MDVAAFYTTSNLTSEEIAEGDRVHGALTQAVRELASAQLRTWLPYDELEKITSQLREITERLETKARHGAFGVELTTDGGVRNHGNAVVGLRNPAAMALGDAKIVWSEKGASASIHLNELYEGPPGHVHGGVLALVLDQLFGEAGAAAGSPGMTGRLTLSYRRPTPLGDVSMEAWLDRVEGIKTYIKGHLKDAAGQVTVEAEGLFILPRWARENADSWPRRPPTFE